MFKLFSIYDLLIVFSLLLITAVLGRMQRGMRMLNARVSMLSHLVRELRVELELLEQTERGSGREARGEGDTATGGDRRVRLSDFKELEEQDRRLAASLDHDFGRIKSGGE